jgi:hypothetical protein
MTTADFIAACFWPFVAIAAFVLMKVRNSEALLFVVRIVTAVGVAYAVLWLFYGKSSIIAVNDANAGIVVLGLAIVGSQLLRPRSEGSRGDRTKSLAAMVLTVLFGSALAWFAGRMLVLDFFTQRLVIEGRVDAVRRSTGRSAEYLVEIAGRTVKVTAPIYERLKEFRPTVRVEVGRGSNYVYEIEYLTN